MERQQDPNLYKGSNPDALPIMLCINMPETEMTRLCERSEMYSLPARRKSVRCRVEEYPQNNPARSPYTTARILGRLYSCGLAEEVRFELTHPCGLLAVFKAAAFPLGLFLRRRGAAAWYTRGDLNPQMSFPNTRV